MTDWATLNGERVLTGSVMLPRVGAWVGDVSLALSATVASSVVLTFGTLSLVGTIVRAGTYGGSRAYRIVGGAGGWSKALQARSYVNAGGVTSAMVLGDAAREVGETVSIAAPEYLGTSYVRLAGAASRVLAAIAPDWWVDTKGVTQVGTPRDGSMIASESTLTAMDGAAGIIEIATEDEAAWMPGRTFINPLITNPRTISASRFHFTRDGKSRVEVLTT